MAKYGIEAFKDNKLVAYPIGAKETYGTLTFTGSEVRNKFVYVDDDGEVHEEQNAQNTWKAKDTGQPQDKYIMAYSSKTKDVMDIHVPLDFDVDGLEFDQELELVGAVVTIGNSEKEQKVVTRNGEQIRPVDCKTFPVQVEDIKVKDSKAISQSTQSQSKSEQSSKPKE
ncbi:DUF961 domain-containing protein [Lactococcus lactis]|uniref:DUF961 domain-containing protein n=1 Tax=Lactococcus lactis TaxID=1358 RepID=UPI0028BD996B|nr:DUF961 domain-containing protein [Lactococcus lactis]WNN67618.1 DUF961 domain-containing protein [Lactococcus lactis]WPK09635.1 DUF961 domain-containing protein [Lactococcus lactis]